MSAGELSVSAAQATGCPAEIRIPVSRIWRPISGIVLNLLSGLRKAIESIQHDHLSGHPAVEPWRDNLLKRGWPIHVVNDLAALCDLHRAGRFDRGSDDVRTMTGARAAYCAGGRQEKCGDIHGIRKLADLSFTANLRVRTENINFYPVWIRAEVLGFQGQKSAYERGVFNPSVVSIHPFRTARGLLTKVNVRKDCLGWSGLEAYEEKSSLRGVCARFSLPAQAVKCSQARPVSDR
jgi:hypothetical protein